MPDPFAGKDSVDACQLGWVIGKHTIARKNGREFMRKTLLLVAASISMLAPVADAATQLVLHGQRTIFALNTYPTMAGVRFTPALPGLEGCSVSDTVHLDWTTQPENRNMYASLLAAIAAGQKIVVGVSGCSSTGAALIYRVDIMID
ncbi:hypothetical protein GCM10011488_26450 [Steroidobacter agaridevorans]|nr:hypothetical protein GCM10011488_26450 [Steroidobacter agaridevorans]